MVLRKEDGVLYADIAYSVVEPVYEGTDMQLEITMNFARTVEARATDD